MHLEVVCDPPFKKEKKKKKNRQLKAERKAPARPLSELNNVTQIAEVNNTGRWKKLEVDV